MLLLISVCHSELVSLMFQVRCKSFPNPMLHHCISITPAIPSSHNAPESPCANFSLSNVVVPLRLL
ncbi:hypothetical protein M405DRAFT_824635, partial [Rhizopogon salebrosus TDB-379]